MRGCRRLIAVKNGYCRLCWLQAGITAAGRARITAADLTPGTCHQQLSFAGMNQRIGHTDPTHDPPSGQPAPHAAQPACTGTQPELCGPGESRHSGKRHRVASNITARPWPRPGTSPGTSPKPAAGTPGSSPRPAGHWLSSWPATPPER